MTDPRKTVEAFVQAHTARDFTALRATLSDDFRMKTLLGELGPRDYVEFAQAVGQALPDLRMESAYLRTEGDAVHQTFGVSGRHAGTFDLPAPGMKPLPPTNKPVGIKAGELVFIVRDGKITRAATPPGQEGAVVDFLRSMGAKLPPLWIARLVNRVARRYKRV